MPTDAEVKVKRGLWKQVNDMVWPDPYCDEIGKLDWALRYARGPLTCETRLAAASVVSAYIALCRATRDERQHIVRELRRSTDAD